MRPSFFTVLAACLSIFAIIASPRDAHTSATFVIINLDGAGEGFNDPTAVAPVGGNTGTTVGEQRMKAFQFAADIWGGLINSVVPIRVDAQFNPLSCTATSAILGSAGPTTVHRDFPGAPVANTWYAQAQANSLFGGDLAPGTDDINATFSSTIGTPGCLETSGWYYGLDANPPTGKIDFVSVLLHELGHGLGFLSLVSLSTGQKFFGFDDAFIRYLEDHTSGELYPNMTDAERVAASIDTGNLHWIGGNVIAAATGLSSGRDLITGHVQMYAPNPAQSGSSVSHWDTALTPNELMEPIYTGAIHDPGLAVDLFADLGWDVGPSLPAVNIVATDATATEAGLTTGFFTVSRTGPTTSPLTVNYTVGGSATNGTDYTTLSGSVTILVGSASATVTVTPIDDALIEGDETVVLTLASGTGYTIGASNSATVTITDNDLPAVTIVATDATATEAGPTTGSFTVSRTGSNTASLLVNYMVGGTATNGSDYVTLFGSVTILPGSSTATITITPIPDALNEGDETVVMTLTAGTGYTIGDPSSATVTITNQDVAPFVLGGLALSNAEVGVPYDVPLITGGISPYSTTLMKGIIPPGLHVNSTNGHLIGTPTPSKGGSFTARFSDELNSSLTGTFKIKVLGPLGITTTTLKTGTLGKAYKGGVKAAGGNKLRLWSELSGNLTATGLTLNSLTGALTGIPTQSGSFALIIQVTDSLGGSDQNTFTLVIN